MNLDDQLCEELSLLAENARFPISVDIEMVGELLLFDRVYYTLDKRWAIGNLKRLPDRPSQAQVHQALYLAHPEIKGIADHRR